MHHHYRKDSVSVRTCLSEMPEIVSDEVLLVCVEKKKNRARIGGGVLRGKTGAISETSLADLLRQCMSALLHVEDLLSARHRE